MIPYPKVHPKIKRQSPQLMALRHSLPISSYVTLLHGLPFGCGVFDVRLCTDVPESRLEVSLGNLPKPNLTASVVLVWASVVSDSH